MRYIKGLFHSTPVWDSAFVIGDDLFAQILRSFSFLVKYLKRQKWEMYINYIDKDYCLRKMSSTHICYFHHIGQLAMSKLAYFHTRSPSWHNLWTEPGIFHLLDYIAWLETRDLT